MQKTAPEHAPARREPGPMTIPGLHVGAAGSAKTAAAPTLWRKLRTAREQFGLDAVTTGLLLLVGAGLIYEDAFRRDSSHGVFWVGLGLLGVGVICRRPLSTGSRDAAPVRAPTGPLGVERVFKGEA
jgi:hypothetical protein